MSNQFISCTNTMLNSKKTEVEILDNEEKERKRIIRVVAIICDFCFDKRCLGTNITIPGKR